MQKKFFKRLAQDPLYLFSRIAGQGYFLLQSMNKTVQAGEGLRVIGVPVIDVRDGGSLRIGRGVLINSRNKGYHFNMHSPVKLFADMEGAKITIGDNTQIHGACLHAYKEISIGKNCLIAANVQIIDTNGHALSFENLEARSIPGGRVEPIIIEDHVWICANSIILPGVRIGRGSVIAASSVVTKDIPPMVVAGGNPAKIIKRAISEVPAVALTGTLT